VEVGEYLMDQRADINARDYLGYTLLYNACRRGQLGLLELLVSMGADPTIPDG